MTIYHLVSIFAPLIESCMFFLLFEAFLEHNTQRKKWQLIIGIVGFACFIGICNHFLIYSLANVILIVAAGVIVSFIFYQGTLGKRVLASVMVAVISSISEVCAAHLVALISEQGIENTLMVPAYRAAAIIVSKILGILICNAIRVKSELKYSKMGRKLWMIFLLLFVSSVFVIYLISKLTYESNKQADTMMAVICAFGMFFITFFSIYLYERLAKQSEEIRAQERYKEHMRSQLSHLTDLVAGQEELRGMKHDMKNHLVTIQGYLKNNDLQGGLNHVSQLLQNQEAEILTIKTGNLALDTMLSTKQAVAERNNITFTMRVQISKELFIRPVDQCVIFGNALDNAIEACERCPTDQRFIDVFLVERQGRLICKIVNPLPPDHAGNSLMTTKADKENHGFGLINLRRALARYGCEPIFEQENGRFLFSFIAFEQENDEPQNSIEE